MQDREKDAEYILEQILAFFKGEAQIYITRGNHPEGGDLFVSFLPKKEPGK